MKGGISYADLCTGCRRLTADADLQLRRGHLLILENPENSLHPAMQVQYAENIVDLQSNLCIPILLNTNSPYFLEALELYTRKKETDFRTYLHQKIDGNSVLIDVTENMEPVYTEMAEPFEILDKVRRELNEEKEDVWEEDV